MHANRSHMHAKDPTFHVSVKWIMEMQINQHTLEMSVFKMFSWTKYGRRQLFSKEFFIIIVTYTIDLRKTKTLCIIY